jgi:hypothetical protein
MIRGVITTGAVLRNAPMILRLYGPRVFGRCMWAIATRAERTFLSLLFGGTQ